MAHLLSSDSDTTPIAADDDEVLSSSSGDDDGDGDSSAPDDFELDAAVGEARAYAWGRKTVLRAGRGQSWEKPATGDEVSVEWAKTADTEDEPDALEATTFTLGERFPDGVRKGIETMKAGERARLTLRSGATYLVELVSFREVRSLAGGRVVKTTLATSASGGVPRPPWEVVLAVRLSLADGEKCVAERDDWTVRLGDKAARPRGLEVAARAMRLGERARVTIDAEYGFGAAGDAALGVPPGAALVAEVTLLRWRRVVHLSRRHPSAVVIDDADTPPAAAPRVFPTESARVLTRAWVLAPSTMGDVRVEYEPEEEAEVSGPYKLENTDEVDGARWWTLGRGLAIEGVERALIMMRPGESAELRCPPALAWGDGGAPALGVAPGADARVRLELLDVAPPPPELCAPGALDGAAEALNAAAARKALGASLFGGGKLRAALRQFEAAAAAAAVAAKAAEKADHDGGDDAAEQAKQLRITALSNAALCWLKRARPRAAERCATAALELDAGCAKALYRRGEARCELRDAAGARADAKALLEVEPNGSAARALMRRAVALRRDEQQKESSAYRRMFGADSDSDD